MVLSSRPNNPFVEFSKEETEGSLVDRFENQVDAYPHQLAVKTENLEFTYHTLNRAANRIINAQMIKGIA